MLIFINFATSKAFLSFGELFVRWIDWFLHCKEPFEPQKVPWLYFQYNLGSIQKVFTDVCLEEYCLTEVVPDFQAFL